MQWKSTDQILGGGVTYEQRRERSIIVVKLYKRLVYHDKPFLILYFNMDYKFKSHHKKILADTITPVSVYLKIRDRFPNSILLESSDYHANDNSFSYICCNPIASIKIEDETILEQFPDGKIVTSEIGPETDVVQTINDFSQKFEADENSFKFINNGLFGYMAYDAVRYFEDIEIGKKDKNLNIPDIYYAVYQNIIAINHFKNEAYIFAHCYEKDSNINEIERVLNVKNFASYNFNKEGAPTSNLKDEEYKEHVEFFNWYFQEGFPKGSKGMNSMYTEPYVL